MSLTVVFYVSIEIFTLRIVFRGKLERVESLVEGKKRTRIRVYAHGTSITDRASRVGEALKGHGAE